MHSRSPAPKRPILLGYPSRVKWPLLLTTVAFVLAGAALGYASLAGGPLPAATAVIFLVLLLFRFRRQPEQPGAYMLGAGLAGALILFKVIADCSPPSCHYQIITPIVGVVFIVVAIAGAGLLVRAVMQHRFSEPLGQ
jgi:peptidoglycan/LPS O-acetylase OafA/YrhL